MESAFITTEPGLALQGGPLYLQVRARIVSRIADGTWSPGAALPTEMQLAATFGVSQGTVRKALDALVAENMVVRRQGKGTYVTQHTPQRALFHFFHLIGNDGSRELPTTRRIVSCRRREPTKEESEKLGLPATGRVIEIERVRDLAERPSIHERIVVSARLFPDLGRTTDAPLPNELYQLYERQYGVTIHRAVETLRAVNAGKREAMLLDVEPGAPLLEVQRLALTVDGTPVERRISRCDTRRHTYLSEIV